MPNLAGFDLVIEVARMAIERELLNTPFASDTNGPKNDTLVPPFMLYRTVPLPGFTGQLGLKVTRLDLLADPGSTLITLHMVFEQCSLEGPGIAVGQMAGEANVTAMLSFSPPAPRPGTSQLVSELVLDFNLAVSNLVLDGDSNSRLDQQVGPALVSALRKAMDTSLSDLFRSQGIVNLNFAFEIDPSRDSTSMKILTSAPGLRWIDSETLGIFGYHRRGANTGAVAWKKNSDLPPAPYPGFPWYPITVLISPFSFHHLVACKAIRSAARDHVAGRHRTNWINEEKANHGNQGDPTPGEIAAADSRLVQYLDSVEGQAEIDGAYPAPCGRGQMDQRIDSTTTGYIDWLSMDLSEGRIDILAKAHAKVTCANVSVEVPMSIQPFIGTGNSIQAGPITRGQPSSDVDADFWCGALTALGLSFLVGPLTGSIMAVVGVNAAESLLENLLSNAIMEKGMPGPKMGNGGLGLPAAVRLKELVMSTSGLTIQGVWDGMVVDPRQMNPSVHLYWQTRHNRAGSFTTMRGSFEADCGGEPRTFSYDTTEWETIVDFTLDVGDVPRPLRYDDWWLWHDGVAHKLVPGTLTFPGRVIIPSPPDNEKLEYREEIVVVVEGSREQGYTLTFRPEDANVPFQLETRMVDGSGRSWPLGTNHQTSQGITFTFDQEYIDFREECARFMIGVVSKYQLVQQVPVWDKVTSIENIVQDRLRGVMHNRELGAGASIRQLMIDQPEIAQQLFRQ